jgi:uncharacterized hydrophobic protein (TIGR00271 family)
MNEQSSKLSTPRHPFLEWWSSHVATSVDRPGVVAKVHDEAGWSAHYVFMTIMSAGIAILGLLLSSPAVVIGAMLISPLMGPIIGLGFGLAVFDAAEIKRTLAALLLGVALAIGFCALIVLVSPLQTVTDEIAARTRPNLFDLLVALFSGLAGTYAMIRGRHGTIVGVAIATALMPPLAVVGFGLATANWTVFWGSSLLFLTNLMTIAVSAAILARIYGFAGHLSPRQTGLQATLVVATFLALGAPLFLSLRQIAWETVASRQARDVVTQYFGSDSRLSEISIDYGANPMIVEATVLTPVIRRDAESTIGRELRQSLRRPVEVAIDQFGVGAEDSADAAAVAAARGGAAERIRSRLAERLALVAGVAPDEVLIDRTNRRALVRAMPLPGADLASYQALEARVAASETGWSILVIPPAAALPDIPFEGDAPTEAGRRALAAAAWAAQRLRLPIRVSGASSRVEAAVMALREAGADARAVRGGRGGTVTLEWLTTEAVEPVGAQAAAEAGRAAP